MSFYVYLPSSTITKIYDHTNTPGDYKIQLAEELNLKEQDWVVGLQEIFIPYYISNITDDMTTMNVFFKKTGENGEIEQAKKEITIETGNYTVQAFVNEVNAKLSTLENVSLRLKYEYTSKKMKFYSVDYYEGIEFPNLKLQKMLGYSPTKKTVIHHTDEDFKDSKLRFSLPLPVSFNTFNNILYCYTDIIEKSIVGDIFSPLLRLVNLDANYGKMSIIHANFKQPHYHKVSTTNIKEIHIKLCNSLGETLSIKRGETIVILHFKRNITEIENKLLKNKDKAITTLLKHLVTEK